MGIIQFLFGKAPKIIFTREGRTAHDLGAKKWDAWKNRFKSDEYNYKQHAGTHGAKSKATNAAETPPSALVAGTRAQNKLDPGSSK